VVEALAPGETTIQTGGTVAGPLSQNLTPDVALAIFGHPVNGTPRADGRPVASDGRMVRPGPIGQARSQWTGKSVGEGSAVEAFAPVMRSDWQAHADHRFVSRWWTSRPVERRINQKRAGSSPQ
jgi:hypothetical protein